MLTEMTLTEPVLIEYIKKMVNEHVAPEDRKAFVESLNARLDGKSFLSDIDIEQKYADLLATLIHDIEYADETDGINIHLITAGTGRKFLLP
jgi:hypothetical protein